MDHGPDHRSRGIGKRYHGGSVIVAIETGAIFASSRMRKAIEKMAFDYMKHYDPRVNRCLSELLYLL